MAEVEEVKNITAEREAYTKVQSRILKQKVRELEN